MDMSAALRSYYGLQSWADQTALIQEQSSSTVNFHDGDVPAKSSYSKSTERKSTEACKSHKEAERRRRQRINAHLSTLRSLLPNTTKTDKASLLAEVVHQVKELRRQVADVARQDGDGCCSSSSSGGSNSSEAESWPFPGECDEATLSYCDDETKLMKATVCCEDRPGLNQDLTRAIRSVRAKAVRAEMMTVGGRTKSVVVMKWAGSGGADDEEIGALKRALKDVVENRVSGPGVAHDPSKRARVDGSGREGCHGFLVGSASSLG